MDSGEGFFFFSQIEFSGKFEVLSSAIEEKGCRVLSGELVIIN
jgi:hypothetical protein